MAEQLTAYGINTRKDGQPTSKKAHAKMLTQQDEFAILLTQVSDCQEAGLEFSFVQLQREGLPNVVALLMPGVKVCNYGHLHIDEMCNYCSGSVQLP